MPLRAAACVVVTPIDREIIVDSKPEGREVTFERIYDERFGEVERWIRAFGGRSSDVADLAQEVFVVAFRRLPTFDGQNVGGWLYQITRRKMRDYRRLAWVKHFFTERTAASYESPAVRADQLTQLENNERHRRLERILNRLPAEQRVAFVLFELDGLTGAEIAQAQQVPINTVWARIHRARLKLQSRAAAEEAKPKP
jgi:RNA polymerase sigma-70 factor, ECF subfamily